jgi:Tfp pilus assembly protein PilF
MLLIWLSFLFIVAAVVILFFVFFHKMPLLANIDIVNLPAEREAAKKQSIIDDRIRRQLAQHGWWWRNLLEPLLARIKGIFWHGYGYLQKLDRQHLKNRLQDQGLNLQRAQQLLIDAEEALKKDELGSAERLAVESLELDKSKIDSFVILAEIYQKQKKYQEAEETWLYVIKRLSQKYRADQARGRLEEAFKVGQQLAEYQCSLGQLCLRNDHLERADQCLRQALKFEPKNPRYLDTLLEISIIRKDHVTAVLIFDTLAEVDPSNKNLVVYQTKIQQL